MHWEEQGQHIQGMVYHLLKPDFEAALTLRQKTLPARQQANPFLFNFSIDYQNT